MTRLERRDMFTVQIQIQCRSVMSISRHFTIRFSFIGVVCDLMQKIYEVAVYFSSPRRLWVKMSALRVKTVR